jgi:two-component system, NtrC family, response regulator AtoC
MPGEKRFNILIVDDEKIIHQTIGDYLQDIGHRIDSAYDGAAAITSIELKEYDLALVDVKMPGMDGLALLKHVQEINPIMPVVIITGHGTMENVIHALRLGAADFLTKPVKLLELDAVLEKSQNIAALRREKLHLKETIKGIQASHELGTGGGRFIGTSRATQKIKEQIHQAVHADCNTILITGETGTGKEVVARQIHSLANQETRPFIAVSCPALPESLLESELFGHIKGTFTGATGDRAGYFELADGGTLFLDEIADLSASAQATLLRVLETRVLRRVGGSSEINVDVRLIAATNANLEKLVASGKFREDLYYRINVYSIYILPLSKRRRDIMPLAEHFLAVYAALKNISFDGFSPQARELLMNHEYRGNARELRNIVELAAIYCDSCLIQSKHISLKKPLKKNRISLSETTEKDIEHTSILNALNETKWNRRQAAKNLHMPYSTLRYKIKVMGIG